MFNSNLYINIQLMLTLPATDTIIHSPPRMLQKTVQETMLPQSRYSRPIKVLILLIPCEKP